MSAHSAPKNLVGNSNRAAAHASRRVGTSESRPAPNQTEILQPAATVTSGATVSPDGQQIVVEYYRELNALTILGHALRQPAPPGLVQRQPNKHPFQTRQEREISLLDPAEQALLREKRVYELPSKEMQ